MASALGNLGGNYEIEDLNVYIGRMQKSVLDKMFFIDKVFDPFSTIVDFGCANGEVIKALQTLFGEYRYIGYDISEEMLCTARENVPTAEFFSDWNEMKVDFSDSLLNISSALHEVYSYCPQEEIDIFWQRVFGSGFKYITMRDMMLSDADQTEADAFWHSAIIEDTEYADNLRDYEKVWGKITTRHDMVHYLLKYKYVENWKREVRENYVPITIEELLKLVPDTYEITYLNHFTLPYTAWQIKNDFGIDLTTPTHIKLILRRKDFVSEDANEKR